MPSVLASCLGGGLTPGHQPDQAWEPLCSGSPALGVTGWDCVLSPGGPRSAPLCPPPEWTEPPWAPSCRSLQLHRTPPLRTVPQIVRAPLPAGAGTRRGGPGGLMGERVALTPALWLGQVARTGVAAPGSPVLRVGMSLQGGDGGCLQTACSGLALVAGGLGRGSHICWVNRLITRFVPAPPAKAPLSSGMTVSSRPGPCSLRLGAGFSVL